MVAPGQRLNSLQCFRALSEVVPRAEDCDFSLRYLHQIFLITQVLSVFAHYKLGLRIDLPTTNMDLIRVVYVSSLRRSFHTISVPHAQSTRASERCPMRGYLNLGDEFLTHNYIKSIGVAVIACRNRPIFPSPCGRRQFIDNRQKVISPVVSRRRDSISFVMVSLKAPNNLEVLFTH
jgi:hypothetical protein